MPHVRLSVRGPNKTGEAHHSFCEIEQQKQSKHIIFGPRTLRRTWGTRPVPNGFCWGTDSAEINLNRRF